MASQVQVDRQRLRQVLLNLLSNAVKYNATGGRVLRRIRRACDTPVLIAARTP